MEFIVDIIRDSNLVIDNLELVDENDIISLLDYFDELQETHKFDISLLISFYRGNTKFTEDEYFQLIKFLDYLDSKRLNECIIFAKHSCFDFCKYEDNRELIRHYKEFEVEKTLFLSFCRYDIINRVKEYMTEENKNCGYNFSLMINSLKSAEFLKSKGAIEYEELTDSNIREVVNLWFDSQDQCEIRFGPIEYWNTSTITDMSRLFSGRTNFNSDISRWNVRSVVRMSGMFYGATDFNSNLSNWNVSNAKKMYYMF